MTSRTLNQMFMPVIVETRKLALEEAAKEAEIYNQMELARHIRYLAAQTPPLEYERI